MSERMAQTRERNRLAREIHDTLGHTLTGITAGLDACLTLLMWHLTRPESSWSFCRRSAGMELKKFAVQ